MSPANTTNGSPPVFSDRSEEARASAETHTGGADELRADESSDEAAIGESPRSRSISFWPPPPASSDLAASSLSHCLWTRARRATGSSPAQMSLHAIERALPLLPAQISSARSKTPGSATPVRRPASSAVVRARPPENTEALSIASSSLARLPPAHESRMPREPDGSERPRSFASVSNQRPMSRSNGSQQTNEEAPGILSTDALKACLIELSVDSTSRASIRPSSAAARTSSALIADGSLSASGILTSLPEEKRDGSARSLASLPGSESSTEKEEYSNPRFPQNLDLAASRILPSCTRSEPQARNSEPGPDDAIFSTKPWKDETFMVPPAFAGLPCGPSALIVADQSGRLANDREIEMLTWFRDNAKIFLIVIIVTFVILIFVDWGTGRYRNNSAGLSAIARMDGKDIPPEEYDASISSVYSRIEGQMRAVGHPNPESELSVMYGMIQDAAFDEMIDNRLREGYLRSIGWDMPDEFAGEAYIKAVFEMMGSTDVETSWRQFTETPGFREQFYQNMLQMRSAMFPAAGRMQNIASRAELAYRIAASYMPVTARFVAFQSSPPIPDDQQLRSFYDSHPELFTYPPNARVRYAVVAIQPDPADVAAAAAAVDSLAMSQTSPDTIVLTRANMLAFASVESLPPVGTLSDNFIGQSMRGSGIPASHRVLVLSVSPFAGGSETGSPEDTVRVLHWEYPVLPGRDALYSTVQDVEDGMEALLAGGIPWSDSLMVLDWGELYVEENGSLPDGIPVSMSAFALDTAWVDSIGPILFSTSYRGGYPALIVARRLERTLESRLVPYEEVAASGELLMTAYSSIAAESSMAMATRALDEMRATGASLGVYAEAESLLIGTTPEFTAADIRAASDMDPESYGGLLANREFALAALTAPILTPIGPFKTGGTAMIAEITMRTELPMPADPAVLAPMYLSVEAEHGSNSVGALIEKLRSISSIEDLRDDFEQALRESRANPAPAPALPAGY